MSLQTYRTQAQKSGFEKVLQQIAQTKLGGKLYVTVFPAIDRVLMPLTRGRLSSTANTPSLLLHVRGARSGELRSVPLLFTPHGESMILVASKAGAPKHPAWYHNLKAHPECEVELKGARIPVRAREVDGPEREELWAKANDNYNGYQTYQGRTARQIPVLLLERR